MKRLLIDTNIYSYALKGEEGVIDTGVGQSMIFIPTQVPEGKHPYPDIRKLKIACAL